jgi:hypothetical protein
MQILEVYASLRIFMQVYGSLRESMGVYASFANQHLSLQFLDKPLLAPVAKVFYLRLGITLLGFKTTLKNRPGRLY